MQSLWLVTKKFSRLRRRKLRYPGSFSLHITEYVDSLVSAAITEILENFLPPSAADSLDLSVYDSRSSEIMYLGDKLLWHIVTICHKVTHMIGIIHVLFSFFFVYDVIYTISSYLLFFLSGSFPFSCLLVFSMKIYYWGEWSSHGKPRIYIVDTFSLCVCV